MKTKQEIENDFEWWITCIPDKINRLEEFLPKEVFQQLDYSINSLDVLEEYLLSKFSFEQMKSNIELQDCLASYLGTSYRRNIPRSQWYVELDNDKDAFYGVPVLRVLNKISFEPHSYVTTIIDRKKGDLLSTTFEKHIKYVSGIQI